ncbi:hypothetical protein EW026_g5071 [Hermanssonia centrifuga]|uniref:CN hydrolase domain-containing protein n=1 Tax=Hermanssonia centrifuga TaxID=98765 RepID=A0A4S4KFA1_9APHY|nr:hypothetical protein EW026_g5071 [Hermanssonia centrifuga]
MTATPPTFKQFTLALVQLGQVGSDKTANLKHAREIVLKAAQGDGDKKPSLVVLPECFNSPYGHVHFPVYAEKINYIHGQAYDIEASESESVKSLSSIAKEAGIWLLGGSIPEKAADGKLYNTATVYSPKGELIATHRKESETLTGGTSTNFFDTDFARIGLGICYDVRFPELTAIAARKGCHMCIYPGAFNLTTGPLHWELLQRVRAVDNQIFFSMCSPARDLSAAYHAWGHSMVIDPMAKVIAEAGHEEEILYADIGPFLRLHSGLPIF